jgi:predicted phage tail component-like protein
MTFNGTDINSIRPDLGQIFLSQITRPIAPPFISYLAVSGIGDGEYDFGNKWDLKTINVLLKIKSTNTANLQALMSAITAIMITPTVKQLSFTDMPNLYYLARVNNVVPPVQEQFYAELQFDFICPIPFMFSNQFSCNFVSDLLTVTVNGTLPNPPSFHVVFTATSTSFQINNGSLYISITDSFAIGDTLDINCATGLIQKNGARELAKLNWQLSTFFNLALGSNSLSITPTGKTTTTMKYNEQSY